MPGLRYLFETMYIDQNEAKTSRYRYGTLHRGAAPWPILARQGPKTFIFEWLYWNPKARQGPGLGCLASRGAAATQCLWSIIHIVRNSI